MASLNGWALISIVSKLHMYHLCINILPFLVSDILHDTEKCVFTDGQ